MQIAVITGATSGIGREFYRLISVHYPRLDEIWCIGRNLKKLSCLPAPKTSRLRVFRLDLSKEEDLQSFSHSLKEHPDVQIKLLVNAAGTGKYGAFEETDPKEHTDTIRLNCEALTALTAICLPYMKAKSRLIQICSGSAFFPQPDFAVYSASKAYVLAFSRALAAELKPRGITVTTVCPGPVDTPFLARSREGVSVPDYKRKGTVKASSVARQALLDASKGKSLSIYGTNMKALYLFSQILPGELFTWITSYLNHKGVTHEKN